MGIRATTEDSGNDFDNAMCLRIGVFASSRSEIDVTKEVAARVLILTKINNYNDSAVRRRSAFARKNYFEVSNRESIRARVESTPDSRGVEGGEVRLRQNLSRDTSVLTLSARQAHRVRHRSRLLGPMAMHNVNPLPDLVPVMFGPQEEQDAVAAAMGAQLRLVAARFDHLHHEQQAQQAAMFNWLGQPVNIHHWIVNVAFFVGDLLLPLQIDFF